MNILIPSLIGLFLASLIAVELLRKKTVDPLTSWISTYLTGPYSFIEDAGFVALAVALFLYPSSGTASIVLGIGSICVFLSMASRRFLPYFISSVSLVTRIHVVVSGLAFLTTAAGLLLLRSLPVSGVLVGTVLVDLILLVLYSDDPPTQQIIEKVSVAGIGIAALVPLLV